MKFTTKGHRLFADIETFAQQMEMTYMTTSTGEPTVFEWTFFDEKDLQLVKTHFQTRLDTCFEQIEKNDWFLELMQLREMQEPKKVCCPHCGGKL